MRNDSKLMSRALFTTSQNYSRAAFLLALIALAVDLTTDIHRGLLYSLPLSLGVLASVWLILGGIFVTRRLTTDRRTIVCSALVAIPLLPFVLLSDALSFWISLLLRAPIAGREGLKGRSIQRHRD